MLEVTLAFCVIIPVYVSNQAKTWKVAEADSQPRSTVHVRGSLIEGRTTRNAGIHPVLLPNSNPCTGSRPRRGIVYNEGNATRHGISWQILKSPVGQIAMERDGDL